MRMSGCRFCFIAQHISHKTAGPLLTSFVNSQYPDPGLIALLLPDAKSHSNLPLLSVDLTRRTMEECKDIVWMGWLLLGSVRSRELSAAVPADCDMFFVLTNESIDCFVPPSAMSQKFVATSSKNAINDLISNGFVKFKSIELSEIIFMKRGQASLSLFTTTGREYISGSAGDKDGAASVNVLYDWLLNLGVSGRIGEALSYHSEPDDTPAGDTEALRIHTMVKDVSVFASSDMRFLNLKKKVLYLANSQCNDINEEARIMDCLQSLQLSGTRCVIYLISAEGGVVSYKVHTETRGFVLSEQEFGSDLNSHDADAVAARLDEFMREVLLPIARQNRALILCSGCNDDALAAALERVVVPEQLRMGQNCPFKILTFVWSFEVNYNATCGIGIAGQIATQCSDWTVRLDKLSEYMADVPEDQLQRCDMIECSSAVIVFEAYDNGVVQLGPSKAFQTRLLACLARQAPAIAVQMYAADWWHLSELCRSGIPILLLDSRERAITMRSAPRQCSTQLATLSGAFPSDVENMLSTITSARDEGTKMRAREALLERAGEMIESQVEALGKRFIVDYDDSSAAALLHAALWCGISREEVRAEKVPLYKRIEEMARADAGNQFRSAVARPRELSVRKAVDILSVKRRIAVSKAKLLRIQKWLRDNDEGSTNSRSRGRVKELEVGLLRESYDRYNVFSASMMEVLVHPRTISGSLFNLDGVVHPLSTILNVNRLPKDTSLPALLTIQKAWDLIESYHFSADRYKLITKLLYATLLCFVLIASSVPFFNGCGEACNHPLLITFSVMLTTIVSCINFLRPSQRWQELRGAAVQIESEVWRFRTRTGVYRVAFDGSNRAEVDGRFSQRIQELKNEVSTGADLNVVTNAHQQNPGADSSAHRNRTTRATLPDIHAHISSDDHMRNDYGSNSAARHAADQSERAANWRPSRSGHEASGEMTPLLPTQDRLPEEPVLPAVQDDHFSPLQPDEYLQLRIKPAIRFYMDRLFVQILWSRLGMLVHTLIPPLVLIFAYDNSTSGVIFCATLITVSVAWLQFQGTDAKLKRYADVISRLRNHDVWWSCLNPVERNVEESIKLLVEIGETILLDELHAWTSTSAWQELLLRRSPTSQISTHSRTVPFRVVVREV